MPQRLDRATGVIWLDFPPLPCLGCYFRRTLLDTDRAGHIQGGQDSLKWAMIRHILFVQPNNRRTYAAMLAERDQPLLRIHSVGELNRIYETWGLPRPTKKGGPQTA